MLLILYMYKSHFLHTETKLWLLPLRAADFSRHRNTCELCVRKEPLKDRNPDYRFNVGIDLKPHEEFFNTCHRPRKYLCLKPAHSTQIYKYVSLCLALEHTLYCLEFPFILKKHTNEVKACFKVVEMSDYKVSHISYVYSSEWVPKSQWVKNSQSAND